MAFILYGAVALGYFSQAGCCTGLDASTNAERRTGLEPLQQRRQDKGKGGVRLVSCPGSGN